MKNLIQKIKKLIHIVTRKSIKDMDKEEVVFLLKYLLTIIAIIITINIIALINSVGKNSKSITVSNSNSNYTVIEKGEYERLQYVLLLEENLMEPNFIQDYYIIIRNEKGEEYRINGKEYYDKYILGDTVDKNNIDYTK